MHSITIAAALCLIATASANQAHAASDVTPLDNWGRHTTHVDLTIRDNQRDPVYVPTATLLFEVRGYESDDVALVQYYRGSKKVGPELKCAAAHADAIKGSDTKVVRFERCAPDISKFGTAKAGPWRVEVGYKQLAMGKTHPKLASYAFDVKAIGKKPRRTYHIDYDWRLGESWLHLKQDGFGFAIFAWFKKTDERSTTLLDFKLRCFVNGKKLQFTPQSNERVAHIWTDNTKTSPSKGSAAIRTRYALQYFFAPGRPVDFLKANPGAYRCVMTRAGEVDREFHFTIADGKPVKPRCQTGKTSLVRAPESTTLIKTVFKKPQDAPFDRKAYDKRGFFGRGGLTKACF